LIKKNKNIYWPNYTNRRWIFLNDCTKNVWYRKSERGRWYILDRRAHSEKTIYTTVLQIDNAWGWNIYTTVVWII
jgi:hypothetical protein